MSIIYMFAEEPQKRKSTPQSLDKLKKEDVAIFSVATHSAKQLRHFKYAAVHLLISLFSSQDFLAQVGDKMFCCDCISKQEQQRDPLLAASLALSLLWASTLSV